MTACAELSALAAQIAAEKHSPREFLVQLGLRAAGIRRGPLWMLDAARGGSNPLQGTGFRAEFDDGTPEQARHFAGVAATAARIGVPLTRFLTVRVLRDPLDSADGRLSEAAFEFVHAVKRRRLPLAETPEWIRNNLCGTD